MGFGVNPDGPDVVLEGLVSMVLGLAQLFMEKSICDHREMASYFMAYADRSKAAMEQNQNADMVEFFERVRQHLMQRLNISPEIIQ